MIQLTPQAREELIDIYVDQTIDSLDLKTMTLIVADTLRNELGEHTDEQLLTEIAQAYPEITDHLLEA